MNAKLTGIAASFAVVVTLTANPAQANEDHVLLKYDNCSIAEQAQISKAITLASVALDDVIARLSRPKLSVQADATLDRWFGVRTEGERVAEELQHMAERLDSDAEAIVVECDYSDQYTFAWTYMAMDGVGYLGFGRPFFDAALVGGFDSGMGTIIHELAHMVPEVAADDHSYSIPEMEGYARDNPKIALDNAQSYEYLVEELYDLCVVYGSGCGDSLGVSGFVISDADLADLLQPAS